MENKESTLIHNTIFFAIGNVGAKLLQFLIVPFYTYYVSVEQMGKYDVLITFVNLFAPIACCAIYESVYRWLLDSNVSKENVVKNGFILTTVFLIIFNSILSIIFIDIEYKYKWWFLLLIDSSCLYTLIQFTTRGLRHNRLYAFQGVLYVLVLIVSNIIFVFVYRLQALGLFLSMIIANVVTACFSIFCQKIISEYIITGEIKKSLSLSFLAYSLPLVPNNIAWWLVSSVNRLIINWTSGDIMNGIFAISMKFPSALNIVSSFFYQAWQEQSILESTEKEIEIYFSKIFNQYMKMFLSSIIFLLPISKIFVLVFMNEDYYEAYQYIGILYLSSAFNAFSAFFGTAYLTAKNTKGVMFTTFSGALVNVLFTVFFVKKFGLYAAAIGNMLGNLVIWIIRINQTKKYYRIKINRSLLFFLILIVFILNIFVVNANIFKLMFIQLISCIFVCILNKDLISLIMNSFKKLMQRCFQIDH